MTALGIQPDREEPRLLNFGEERIRVLHFTWIAFFMTFYVWFNLAPLATTMRNDLDWLTQDHIKVLLIYNVALTIPARIVVGTLIDRFGVRIVFSGLMVLMAMPAIWFAFTDGFTEVALFGFALFYLVCLFLNRWFYLGPRKEFDNP